MANATTTTSSGGIGFCGMLTILFIGLKITGNITWPWLWVLSPLWIGLCVVLGIIAIILIGFGVMILIKRIYER